MKLSFEQLQIGQKLRCIEKPKKDGGYGLWGQTDLTITFSGSWNSYVIPKDTVITVVEKSKKGGNKSIIVELPEVELKDIKGSLVKVKAGTKGEVFMSELRSFTKEEGSIVPMENDLKQYKIFYEGKQYKPKYFADLGKIKASLLIAFGYYKDQYDLWYNNYRERTPELDGELLPDWIDTDGKFSRNDCKKIEIFEFINHDRKNPIKVNFDVVKYYDE